MTDDTPTPQELAEAEALARALEGGHARPPDDALEVAALLRYAHAPGLAPPALLERACEAAQGAQAVSRRRRMRVSVAALGLGAAAAAALALASLPLTQWQRAPSAAAPAAQLSPASAPAPAAPAPLPLRAVLDAEALALAHPGAPLAALVAASSQQRHQLLSELARHYGGPR